MHASVPRGAAETGTQPPEATHRHRLAEEPLATPPSLRGSIPRNLKGNRTELRSHAEHSHRRSLQPRRSPAEDARGPRACGLHGHAQWHGESETFYYGANGGGRGCWRRGGFSHARLPVACRQPPLRQRGRDVKGRPGPQDNERPHQPPASPQRSHRASQASRQERNACWLPRSGPGPGAGPTGQAEPGVDKAGPEPGHTRVRHRMAPASQSAAEDTRGLARDFTSQSPWKSTVHKPFERLLRKEVLMQLLKNMFLPFS